ncbi:hydrogenase-3 subunit E [Sulfobacillus harzensis]|uniref:Hydrogenase-3 subunit E n=1 Tax=Sulfobacillus harzensis TaxID=2729629 RepID=A0A7Y0L3B0_9FIRM|nr:hydrogenase-3 subunit E [Sulfobacillus harzensis]NMP21941.1 hydrogenase-3 subunit E [Sulfobacillus harzensis]
MEVGDMVQTIPTAATARDWIDAWRVARARDFDSIVLTADGPILATLLMNRKTGALTRLHWDARESDWEDAWQPSWSGIGETVTAEYRLARERPELSWQLPDHPRVRGKGLFTYPLGPVRADVAESLLYRLHVMGDEIIRLTLKNGFKERHIRALVSGRTVQEALPVISRFTTTSNVHHTLAMVLAVEDAWGIQLSHQVQTTRVLLAELERAYSHLGDLAMLAVSTGLPVPQMEYLHLKETVLRLNFSLFGHRYLRAAIVPGGVAARGWPQDVDPVAAARIISDVLDQAERIAMGLERTSSFLDRLHGAGRVPPAAIQWGRPVGPVGRAAGLELDVRQVRPYAAYGDLDLNTPIETDGDAYARFRIRVEELGESLRLVRRILGGWNPHELSPNEAQEVLDGPPVQASGVGIVEAPRGLLGYWLRFDPKDGRIAHAAIATPSERNWAVVPDAMANGNILQDFPIIDASFALSVAGWDG